MADIARRGSLNRRVVETITKLGKTQRHPEYRVTPGCRVPEGVTLARLMEAAERGVAPPSRDA